MEMNHILVAGVNELRSGMVVLEISAFDIKFLLLKKMIRGCRMTL